MIHPVPKPAKRGPKARAPLKQKTRMKQRNAKRGGHMFPKQRQRDFTQWLVTENDCELRGAILLEPLTVADVREGGVWRHRCFGLLTPAHIGQHRAKGAPDFGRTIPLDQGAHSVLDHQSEKFYRATRLTEPYLARRAEGYAVKYVERGGAAPSPDPKEHQ